MISALYVDDEETLLDIAKIYLEKGGEFQIDTALSVNEALLLIGKKNYDVIISDYQMPVKDGLEFLSLIRESGNSIPFILFTGRGREDVVIQAINNGADFYIQKGGDPGSQFAELEHKIKISVDRKQKNDEILGKNRELNEINKKLEKTEEELRNKLEEVSRKKAELDESRNRLQQIITFLPDPTFAIDNEGKVIAWNSAMEDLSGAQAEEILGKGDYEYAYRLYGVKRPILIDLVLDPGIKNEYDFPLVISDGNQIFSENLFSSINGMKNVSMWYTASPLYDIDGNVSGAIESIRDITRIKLTEKLVEIQRDLGFSLGKTTTLEGAMEALLNSSLCLEEVDSGGIYIIDHDSGTMKLMASTGVSCKFRDLVSVFKMKETDSGLRKEAVDLTADDSFFMNINPGFLENEGIEYFHVVGLIFKDELLGFFVCASHSKIKISPETRTSIEALAAQASGALFRIRMSEERRKIRENLENFFDEIEDYLCVTDTSGNILMTNSALQKYTGYYEEELTGKHISVLHPPDSRDEMDIVINGILKGNLESYFVPIITKSGEIIQTETRVSPGNWGGKPAIFAVSRNISEIREAHDRLLESERRLRAVFDQSFQLAGILDRKGKILDMNKTALNIFGLDLEDLKGRYLSEWASENDRTDLPEKLRDAIGVASRGVSVKSEISIPDRDGFLRNIEFSLRAVRNEAGMVEYMIPEGIDITRRKRAESALLQANHKLILLNGITRHDILNKITPVLGYLEMTRTLYSSPEIDEVIGKMESQVLDIEKLIRFTKLYDELGAVEPVWQNLRSIFDSLRIPSGISLKTDIPEIEIYADPMLEKVFSNLLDNSIRHGKKVTKIEVSCSRTPEGTSIFWKDNGAGIPDELREKIFMRGFGNNSGLGMFLSREILSISDMEIRECGKEGQGAVFEIIVPPGGCRLMKADTGDIDNTE